MGGRADQVHASDGSLLAAGRSEVSPGLGELEAAQGLAGTRVGVTVKGKRWGQKGLGGRADESGGVTGCWG